MRECRTCGMEVDYSSYCGMCHRGWKLSDKIPMLNWVPIGCLKVMVEVEVEV